MTLESSLGVAPSSCLRKGTYAHRCRHGSAQHRRDVDILLGRNIQPQYTQQTPHLGHVWNASAVATVDSHNNNILISSGLLVLQLLCIKKRASRRESKEQNNNTTSRLSKIRGGKQDNEKNKNPLWPNGADEDDIEEITKLILKHSPPDMEIPETPMSLQRDLYKSTVRWVLNGIYQAMGSIHGSTLLGKTLVLQRKRSYPETKKRPLASYKVERQLEDDGSWIYLSRKQQGDRKSLHKQWHKALLHVPVEMKATCQRLAADLLAKNGMRFLGSEDAELALYCNCLEITIQVLLLVGTDSSLIEDLGTFYRNLDTLIAIPDDEKNAHGPSTTSLLDGVSAEAIQDFIGQTIPNRSAKRLLGHWWVGRERIERQRRLSVQLHSSLYALLVSAVDRLIQATNLQLLSNTVRLALVLNEDNIELINGREVNVEHMDSSIASQDKSCSSSLVVQRCFTTAFTLAIGVAVGLSLQHVVDLPPSYPLLTKDQLSVPIEFLLSRWDSYLGQLQRCGSSAWSKKKLVKGWVLSHIQNVGRGKVASNDDS